MNIARATQSMNDTSWRMPQPRVPMLDRLPAMPAPFVASNCPDPDACYYCTRKACLICAEHGARLCGNSACTSFHLDLTQATCGDFRGFVPPARKRYVATRGQVIGWLVGLIAALGIYGGTR